jgi:hypothetical protein
VLWAISLALEANWDEHDYESKDTSPPGIERVPAGYRELVWLWARLARGRTRLLRWSVDYRSRADLNRALALTAPILAVVRGDQGVEDWLAEHYEPYVEKISARIAETEVGGEIEARAGEQVGIRGPTEEGERTTLLQRVIELLGLADRTARLIEGVSSLSKKTEIDREFLRLSKSHHHAEHELPFGEKAEEAITSLGTVLGGLKDLLELLGDKEKSSKELREAIEKYGKGGELRTAADLLAQATSVVAGGTQVIGWAVAAVAKIGRNAAFAEEVLEGLKPLTSLTDRYAILGRVAGAATLLKGAVEVLDPASTLGDRIEGGADVIEGAGLIAGEGLAAPAMIVSLSIKFNLAVLATMQGAKERFVLNGVGRSFEELRTRGDRIAKELQRIDAADSLLAGEKDPERVDAVRKAVAAACGHILNDLQYVLTDRTSPDGPAQWWPIRKRLEEAVGTDLSPPATRKHAAMGRAAIRAIIEMFEKENAAAVARECVLWKLQKLAHDDVGSDE